jgi:hypothetical protein
VNLVNLCELNAKKLRVKKKEIVFFPSERGL